MGEKSSSYGARTSAGSPAPSGAPQVLLVGGSPEPSSAALIARLADDADYVVAVDRGLDRLIAACVEPDLFCGDCDTASPEAVAYLQRLVDGGRAAVETYDPHKDYTDLTLALQAADARWPGAQLTLTCFGGGRPDHLLAVLGTLARRADAVRLEEDGFTGRILHGPGSALPADPVAAAGIEAVAGVDAPAPPAGPHAPAAGEGASAEQRWVIGNRRGAAFSFISLTPGTVVSEQGMEWELDHKRCELLGDLGVSNVLRADPAVFTCHAGCAVAYVFTT